MTQIVSFEVLKQRRVEARVYERWVEQYQAQTHQELLEALVHEHEQNFPMRRSPEMIEQLRHKALVNVLQERAQTQFLKTLLEEIRTQGHN